jgi:hypothetical protein
MGRRVRREVVERAQVLAESSPEARRYFEETCSGVLSGRYVDCGYMAGDTDVTLSRGEVAELLKRLRAVS